MKILETVASERHGYRYGKPLRIDEKFLSVVLPIIRETTLKRQYTTLIETDKVLVFDTGRIDVMEADNQSDENVFVRSGTIFRGATQERALQRSIVLFPGKKTQMPVRCVHMSRGINPSAKAQKYDDITPLHFDQANYAKGYTPKDQSTFWANVQKTTAHMKAMQGKGQSLGSKKASGHKLMRSHHASEQVTSFYAGTVGSSAEYCDLIGSDAGLIGHEEPAADFYGGAASFGGGQDDLAKEFDSFAMHFDDVLSKVERQENQAGLALITQAGVETIEFFDHQLSWKALHEAAVKRIGSNALKQDDSSVFEYKPEAAVKAVNKILELDWEENRIYEHKPSNGEPHVKVTGLSAKDYVGEVVEIAGDAMHVTILKTHE
jgi:hypothetical protein